MRALKKLRRYCFIIPFLCTGISSIAQLKADFSTDKPGGCSPLTIAFTNLTTGASPGATYKWDFGNGNTSTIVSPGASYTIEKTYTITLTVTDGTKSSVQTKSITVYKKPVSDFSVSPVKGCLPLPVNFTSTSSAGDGSIASYFWDFGDGNTQQGTTLQQVGHTYNFPENATAGLTVTNTYGCYTTTQKPAAQVLQAIKASFTADHAALCNVSDAVTFTNTSSGPGTLNYVWDFGDGGSSTAQNPSHVYAKKGVYTVKLTASNTDGCTNTVVQTNYINVSSFTVDFDVPGLVCKSAIVTFPDKSTAGGINPVFTIDGISYAYYPNSQYSFPTAGNHTVQLSETFGSCVITSALKTIPVKDVPVPQPFIITVPSFCTLPVSVSFKDTTQSVTSWKWNFNYPSGQTSSTAQSPSYTYSTEGTFYTNVTLTNAAGCSASETQSVNIAKANAAISLVSIDNPNGCGSVTATFAASPANEIQTYQWVFGDGASSTVPQPTHTFSVAGTYIIQLNYVTKNGCKASTNYSSITVYKKPVADFSSSSTSVCGSTPVTFNDQSTGAVTGWTWDFGTGNYTMAPGNVSPQKPVVQYTDSGTYSVRLIVTNGTCSDTTTKMAYLKVSPPFPKISGAFNTCDGTRGLVKFTEKSKYALSWKWDFGDGSSSQTFTTVQDTVQHVYTKSGTYHVTLTTINGSCSVTDNLTVYVLLKQNPVLQSALKEICSSNVLDVQVINLQVNPAASASASGSYYYFTKWQYGDGTTFTGTTFSNNVYWQTTYSGSLSGLANGKQNLRAILISSYFACADTTNIVPLKIKGPVAGFMIPGNDVCYKSPAIFTDTSHGTGNVPIRKWMWNFGDGSTVTMPTGGMITHHYAVPGYFYPSLTVTDSQGCAAASSSYSAVAQANGPRADFSYSPAFVSPNTPVSFYNNTNTTGAANVQYQWSFGDGTVSTAAYPSHAYANLGYDTVKLIARNPATNCSDTTIQVIHVKDVNAAFTFITSYINNNSCPPVVVQFTNKSINASRVAWDFGDGSMADNLDYPSHTYGKPGVYKIILYGYDANGLMDSTVDSVVVKGPYALLHADVMSGCISQTVTLSAEVRNASSFTWDFADGTLKQTKDTFAVHAYLTPGLYSPSLILKDNAGCSSTSDLGDTIVIDTLHIAIRKSLQLVCDSGKVSFAPDVQSLAADQLHKPLRYKWDFGTGNVKDTSGASTPVFNYNRPGHYIITLQVWSPYGCTKLVTDSVIVVAKSKASIAGPPATCPGVPVIFKGFATNSSSLVNWNWNFKNGDASGIQDPSAEAFTDAGTYSVQLIVAGNGCMDTAYHDVVVNPKPNVQLQPQQPAICLGKSVQLTAGTGTTYQWTPAAGLDNATIAMPLASPPKTTTYTVKVTNGFGCSNSDSLTVIVAGPFTVKVPVDTFLCTGSSIQLNASGANSYQWIGNTMGLSNTKIADPIVNTQAETSYTVVGYDAYGCFTDTANVHVQIAPLPSVNAGPDLETLTGSTVQLNASGSSDVVQWSWLPQDYLSCTDCEAPISTPRSNINYIVTGKTKYGCAASDTVVIKLVCAQDKLYIPDAFSPNNDGKNDVFYVKGKGIKIIRSMRIFSRWGEMVFERTNINVDDRSAAWDGTYKGNPVPTGAYVYIAEMVCDTGEVFPVKGTLVIIR